MAANFREFVRLELPLQKTNPLDFLDLGGLFFESAIALTTELIINSPRVRPELKLAGYP